MIGKEAVQILTGLQQQRARTVVALSGGEHGAGSLVAGSAAHRQRRAPRRAGLGLDQGTGLARGLLETVGAQQAVGIFQPQPRRERPGGADHGVIATDGERIIARLERLPGDEPEILEVVPWALDRLHELMLQEDCSEGRSLAALFIVREYLQRRGTIEGPTP